MSDLSSHPKAPAAGQDIPGLEADLAYFEARLSLLLGGPDSLYQRAQLRTYHALEEALHIELDSLRRDSDKTG
jgi:hypothetical protein